MDSSASKAGTTQSEAMWTRFPGPKASMVVTLNSVMSKFLPVVAVEAARIVHNHFIQSGRRSCKALDLPALFAAGRATPSFFIHDLAPFLVVEVMNVPVPRRL